MLVALVRGVKVTRVKRIVIIFIIATIFLSSVGCRNNLVNKWDNYTGDTDVYYHEPNETIKFETTQAESTETVEAVLGYGIPEYWNAELWDVVTESRKIIAETKGNSTTFLWYNDAHLSYSARLSVPILTFLQDHINVQYVNFGGDIVSDNPDVEHDEIVAQLRSWRKATLALSGHHSVVGNHDDDIEEFSTRADLYDFLLKDETNKIADENNNFCYYVDNFEEQTRYIYLSTGFDETTSEDIRFLVNALCRTAKEWHIVLVSHIWFSYNSTLTPTEGKVPEFAQTILNVLDDYNARNSGSENGIDYNFSDADAKVEFCIGGHTHVDFEFFTEGGIPVVLTETDSYHLRGDNKKNDKTDEAAVSVIVVDYNMQVIHIIRAGRGQNRTVPLAEN